MSFIIVYITHKNLEEAKNVSEHLLKLKLIACVNYFPIESAYWWKGKIENAKEIVSLVKSKKGNWEKIKSEVTKIHPYETPCIMKVDVESNKDYEKWINKVKMHKNKEIMINEEDESIMCMLASEQVLKRDWLNKEDGEAWNYL